MRQFVERLYQRHRHRCREGELVLHRHGFARADSGQMVLIRSLGLQVGERSRRRINYHRIESGGTGSVVKHCFPARHIVCLPGDGGGERRHGHFRTRRSTAANYLLNSQVVDMVHRTAVAHLRRSRSDSTDSHIVAGALILRQIHVALHVRSGAAVKGGELGKRGQVIRVGHHTHSHPALAC